MQVYFVDAPPELLEERQRLGLDKRDEVWEGVYHVVPQPVSNHQIFTLRFAAAILPLADRRGLVLAPDVAIYQPGQQDFDYRVPDLVLLRRQFKARRGVAGPPEFVMEVLSPRDESRKKFPFFAALGCREVLLVDRARRAIELYRLVDGGLVVAQPDAGGAVRLEALDIDLTVVGGGLRLAWEGGEAEIPFEDD